MLSISIRILSNQSGYYPKQLQLHEPWQPWHSNVRKTHGGGSWRELSSLRTDGKPPSHSTIRGKATAAPLRGGIKRWLAEGFHDEVKTSDQHVALFETGVSARLGKGKIHPTHVCCAAAAQHQHRTWGAAGCSWCAPPGLLTNLSKGTWANTLMFYQA